MFGAEKDEEVDKFRILHYEEICDSYWSSEIFSVN
jgi:hypothetical protein